MLDLLTGVMAIIEFCASGANALPDKTCEDGSLHTYLEVRVAAADNCNPDDCWRRMRLLEVRRNGELILSVPADTLSEKEKEMFFQLFVPLSGFTQPDIKHKPKQKDE